MTTTSINQDFQDESDGLISISHEDYPTGGSISQQPGGRLRFTDEAIRAGTAPQTKKTATFMRLLQMSSPDKEIISVATICLCVAAVASTSLPHFTGNVSNLHHFLF